MKFLLIALLILGSLSTFAKQTISCPIDNVEFTFNQDDINKLDESFFIDNHANIQGQFTVVKQQFRKVIFENFQLDGYHVKVIIPNHILNTQSDEFGLIYFRINGNNWHETTMFCSSVIN